MIITSVMMIMIDVAGKVICQYAIILGGDGFDAQYQTWIMSTHFPSAFLSQAL